MPIRDIYQSRIFDRSSRFAAWIDVEVQLNCFDKGLKADRISDLFICQERIVCE
ncbi:MAG: hypothetical protein IPO41_18130 [Acidobacteria bacterium]|nr:hypothetical protein [Acidobacteriota bacterium]